MKNSFDSIKRKVLNIICENKDKEITRKTNIIKSGIYMLYVDCFEDDSIIPFYIGQTNNFQKRHKQHFTEVLSLNRLDNSCYKYALQKGLYNGNYRACKIFSYMVNHRCDIKDLHMIIIEENDNEKERLEIERKYINDLFAPFVGFNQLNCVSQYYEFSSGRCDEEEYKKIINDDYECLALYSNYGYNVFNWFLTSGIFSEEQKKFLSSATDKRYNDMLYYKNRLCDIENEKVNIKNYNHYKYGGACEEAWDICKLDICEFFSHNGLKSEDKQNLVIKILLFNLEEDKKVLTKYLERYKKSKGINILDILSDKYSSFINPIREKILVNQKRYDELEKEEEKISNVVYSVLFPIRFYKSHPLKSMYEKFEFSKLRNDNNICHINIEYTCMKADYDNDFYPEICKIDYYIAKENAIYSREVFIKNSLSTFFETDDIYYYEKGFWKGPFNIFLVGDVKTHIPISMEYKNGINEFSFQGVDMEDEMTIFKEIDSLINSKTKIVYTTSGYKKIIERWLWMSEKENINIIKKLVKMSK